MFTLDQSERYWYPVTVELVDAEGRKKKFDFDGSFERLPEDELKEFFREREEGETKLSDRDVVERVFRGWRKIQTADGADVEVNDENRERLLKTHPVQGCIVKAWLKSIGIEGKSKN
ncbi:MAG: hypothetical protein ABIQ70_13020 [Dokdonella sp.]